MAKIQNKDIKLAAPHVKEPELAQAMNKVYKDLNDLKDSVHNFKGKEESDATEGKEGDIRVVKSPQSSTYTLQIKGDENWLEDKTAKYTSLGADVDVIHEQKKKTLPSTVGGLLPAPDYDSGWVIWDFSVLDIDTTDMMELTHNINSIPRFIQIWFAPDVNSVGATYGSPNIDPTEFSLTGTAVDSSIIKMVVPVPNQSTYSHDYGVMSGVTSTKVMLVAGQYGTLKMTQFDASTSSANYVDGYIRVLLWK